MDLGRLLESFGNAKIMIVSPHTHLGLGVARIALFQHSRKRPERHPHVVLEVHRALPLRARRLGLLIPAVPLQAFNPRLAFNSLKTYSRITPRALW